MKRLTLLLLTIAAAYGMNGIRISLHRSRQKATMSAMHHAAERIEKGKTVGTLVDGWERPMRVRVAGKHFSFQSAGADGKFETWSLDGPVGGLHRDIVMIDGVYWQMPEGI
ncbi:MAG: hypothetical protein ACLGH0_13220 [Thermoanaerobaculia bacterium]